MDISDILILTILVFSYGFTLWKIISKHIEFMDLSKGKIFWLFCAIIFLLTSAFIFLGVTVFQDFIKTAWSVMQTNPKSYEFLFTGFAFFVIPIWVMCTLITKDFIINTLAWMEAIDDSIVSLLKWILYCVKHTQKKLKTFLLK